MNEREKEKLKFHASCTFLGMLTVGCIILLCLSLTGCAPKEEIAILSEKDTTEETRNDVVKKSRENVEIPSHYEFDWKNEDGSEIVSFDAEVKVPKTDGLTDGLSRKVVKPCALSKEEANTFIKNIFKDGNLSTPGNIGGEDMVIPGWVGTEDGIKYDVNLFGYWIKEDTKLVGGGVWLSRRESEKEKQSNKKYTFEYGQKNIISSLEEMEKVWEREGVKKKSAPVSDQAARETADEWIQKFGLKDYICSETIIEPEIDFGKVDADSYTGNSDFSYTGNAMLKFTYTKVIDRVPEVFGDMGDILYDESRKKGKEGVNYFWPQEKIIIRVDGKGMKELKMQGLSENAGTKEERINLLTFPELKTICEKMVPEYLKESIQNMYGGELPQTMVTQITKMELGYMKRLDIESVENDDIQAVLEPVWCLYGKRHYKYENSDYLESADEEPLLTISAVDGSWIQSNVHEKSEENEQKLTE